MKSLIFKRHFNAGFVKRMLDWHFRFYVRRIGFPVSAGVYITSGCNFRCVMCDIWKNKEVEVFPRDLQERSIDVLAKVGCYYYSVSGGEPTLVKDLPDRLAYAARKIPYVHLVTNGLRMTPETARDLSKAGVKEVSVSIDGLADYHDKVRGIDGSFDKAMRAIDALRTHAPDVRIVVNTVLSQYNVRQLPTLRKLLADMPGVLYKFLPLSFHQIFLTEGRESLGLEDFEAATQAEIDMLLDDANADPLNVNSPIFLKKVKRFLHGDPDVLAEQKKCLYPFHAIEFDHRGHAFPCITGCKGVSSWQRDAEGDLYRTLTSPEWRNKQQELTSCTGCKGAMPLCYYEPRLNFPIGNLLRYSKAILCQ